jgi:hypothetical protein
LRKNLHLRFQAHIPVGVIFEDEGAGYVLVDNAAPKSDNQDWKPVDVINPPLKHIHMRPPRPFVSACKASVPAAGVSWQHLFEDIYPGHSVNPRDVELAQCGRQRQGISAIGAPGKVDGEDVLELEGSQHDN